MIQNRWMIPAGFAGACAALSAVSVVASSSGSIHSSVVSVTTNEPHTWKDLDLHKDRRYTLKMRPVAGVSIGEEKVIAATLSQGDNVIFDLEDAYWHERGTWREGGESGTWEEQNSASEFSFVVPDDGKYELEFSMSSHRATDGERLEAALDWREPWALTWWPLGIGAILLLGVAGWTYSNRGNAVGKFLGQMDVGSKLELEGVEYTVLARMEHWEGSDPVGVEFRLRSEAGQERWLAIEEFWREHPYIEDGDQTLVQTLIDVPMTDAALAQLATQNPHDSHVIVEGEYYDRDRENGGIGSLITTRDGAVYKTRYTCEVFRDASHFPLQPGDRWIECITWGPDDVEWSVMQLVDVDTLKLTELKFAEPLTLADINNPQSNNPDPFGVAHLRGKRADVQRTAPAQQQTQAPQSQAAWQAPDWDS